MKGKKKDSANLVVNEPITGDKLTANESVKTPVKASDDKNKKNLKAGNVGGENIFVRFFKRIKKACKESWSELKKVSWTPFKKVISNTAIVLLVVVVFLGVLLAFDTGFSKLFDVIIKGL